LLPIAVFGLLGNLAGVFLLKKSSSESLNIKAVYLHLWGDTLSSVAVIFAGIMIHFTGYYAIDTLVTIFISGIIIKEALIVLSQTVNILMQGAPAGTDLEGIKASIISIPYVSNIHHVHIWNLDDSEIFLEAHIKLDNDLKLSQTSEIREKIESILRNKFKISHTTLQLEFIECNGNCN
jgi:cobalt-zinc-cadmium efflux system protein